MKVAFYPKLANDGIRKNKRLYIPYLLTGTVMVMMYYIVSFLASTEILEHMKGGSVLRTMLPLGSVVIAVFSLTFLFYSNSFLIRQRNKEFGLYNILGMDKGNLGRVMYWENLITSTISIFTGLVLGIVLSKLAELVMLNLLNQKINYTIRLDLLSAGKTAILFVGIYVILLLNSVIKVRRSNPLELLHSSNVGEKAPKANWLFAILGVLILGVAYYIAISVEQPLTAMVWFLVAVILVIVATYLLFISGSVAFCRILQKNKRYYYKPNHFVSVSSMVYRMKRNGAGLASICILITMVLVMLSSTLSLYIGAEDALTNQYPQDIALRLSVPNVEQFTKENFTQMCQWVQENVPVQKDVLEYSSGEIAGLLTEDGILVDKNAVNQFDFTTYENVGYLQIITLEDYNRVMGTSETLKEDECLLYCFRTNYNGKTFSIEGGSPLKVKSVLKEMFISGYSVMQIVPTITLVTADFNDVVKPLLSLMNSWGDSMLQLFWNYSFDMDTDTKTQLATYELLRDNIHEIVIREEDGSYSYRLDGKEAERAEYYGLYGGLFFIGILLSIVFLFAAVLIIYYKQISEGFEDQKRFEVMQKVGMTKRDIRKSINSQILTVFFLPILFAGLHLAFAFPIVWKLLQLFSLSNMKLMIFVTFCSFLVFALLYALVYKITSNAYFTIVSGRNK